MKKEIFIFLTRLTQVIAATNFLLAGIIRQYRSIKTKNGVRINSKLL